MATRIDTGGVYLVQSACRSRCAWVRDPRRRTNGGLPVFTCAGCSSQWVSSESWTPADLDGTVSPAVAAEAKRRRSR